MDSEDCFPVDPLESTLKYVGSNQVPFAIPWAKGRVQLLAGLNSYHAENDGTFVSNTAFEPFANGLFLYQPHHITSFRDESSSNQTSSSEKTGLAVTASIGGSFLGASGRGKYEKDLHTNKSKSHISITVDHVCGNIEIVQTPQLTPEAVRVLNDSPDPVDQFRQKYGDFYVAGYQIGATNSTTVSGHLAHKSFFEFTQIEVKVTVLWAEYEKSSRELSLSRSDLGGLNVSAYDSLACFQTNFTARNYDESLQAARIASANKERAMTISLRASDILWAEFSINRDQRSFIQQEVLDLLCDRGLITALQLAPFASLRQYQSSICRRQNLKQASILKSS